MRIATLLLVLLLAGLSPLGMKAASAAPALDGCNHFIDSLPATVDTPGTWCLRANLVSGTWTGAPYAAITITSNDVVLDCNGFGITGPGINSDYSGISAYQRNRVTVRRCNVARYRVGILAEDYDGIASDLTYEDNFVTDSGYVGLWSTIRGTTMRRNHVKRTGGMVTSSEYYGVIVQDGLVAENLVEDMVWPSGFDGTGVVHTVTGIRAGGPGRVTIRDNRIRKLKSDYGMGAIGIAYWGGGTANIIGNDVAGDMVSTYSTGIYCNNEQPLYVPAVDNVVTGFPQPVQNCIGAHDNDVSQ
jgi:hypothetical protein